MRTSENRTTEIRWSQGPGVVPVLKIACFSFCDLHANLDQFPLVFLLQQEIPTVASSCPSAERFDDGNLVVLGDTQDTVSLL
jgi:hypothetical protein